MRGWIILFGLLGMSSLGAIGLGDASVGVKGLGAISMSLCVLTLLTNVVRGRA
ncbi:MAG: hypothetical protein ABIR70_21465 [Bryobacteraceae bacterium]